MSDVQRLLGPDGHPSDRASFVGSPRSASASFYGRTDDAPVIKPAPWGEEGSGRGPFAWSDDEFASVIRGMTFPEPTPEAKAAAQREAQLFEAIKSGAIWRKKPGRKPGKSRKRDAYRFLAQACLDEAGGRSKKAEQNFIKIACARAHIGPERAKNCWYEATEPDGLTRRARR